MQKLFLASLPLAALLVLMPGAGLAQTVPVTGETAPLSEDEQKAVWDAASKVAVHGPQDVNLGDQATLHVAADHIYVPPQEGGALMRMWGNSSSPGFYGLLFSSISGQDWVISFDHVAEGYVRDDDAKTWNAADLLQSLKDGTEAQNVEREKMGIPGIEVIGWLQEPSYDADKHQLVWSMNFKSQGDAADASPGVNFNTYALGRDGYFEVNLMSDAAHLAADKPEALKAISAVEYKEGKRYADFQEGTDRIAEYGLAALVAGVAAKKLGLLAVIGVFLAKFAKVLLGVGIVAAAGIARLFNRKKPAGDA
jgi:uncharacterized membrane-anchored protein